MRAVLQRVTSASVVVASTIVGQIDHGWMILLGIGQGDSEIDVDYMVDRILKLRGFSDANGKMNLSLEQVGGSILLVSQFTLYADVRSRRPGFAAAADSELAQKLYQLTSEKLRAAGARIERGIFAADMQIALVNDGPMTFLLES